MLTSPLALFAQAGQGGMMELLLPLILMFGVFFFLVILPQSRKQKKHQELLKSLQKGDEVVTQSGMYGKIYGLADNVVTLEVSQNCRIRVDRQSIASKATEAKAA